MAVKTSTNYIDWSVIIAGTVLSCAISLLLLHFGQALGFTYERLQTSTDKVWEHYILLILWTLWTQLMASMAGGYMAGRMRTGWVGATQESEVRDGAHGLLVWALASVLVAIASAVAAFWAGLVDNDTAEHTLALSQSMMHRLGIIWGFSIAASSLVSAVAAWWMGTVGGDHRDREVDVAEHISFRRKR